jgi:hypothetical protein
MSSLTIPPQAIPRLRAGACLVLAWAAQEIDARVSERQRDLDAIRDAGEQLRHTWCLLDGIGWTAEGDAGTTIELPVLEHGPATLAALDAIVPLMGEWFGELYSAGASRPERANELRRLHQLVRQAVRDL